MSRNAAYLERIEAAFQGEVYGEALYLAIAMAQQVPDHAWKWRVLVQQETEVKAALRTLLEGYGAVPEELDESRKRGVAEARRYAAMPWAELMRRFSDELDADIDRYAELERGCPPGDAATLRRLTRHEELTREFCELELAGRADESIREILDSLENPPPR